MASFAEIMNQLQPEQSKMPYVPGAPMQGQPMPYVPGMPQGNAMPQAPMPAPMPAPVPAAPQAPAGAVPPEEMAQRQAGWKTIVENLMQQPNSQQIMMAVGLRLLQGQRPGQSVGQLYGSALGAGVKANAMLGENATADADKARKQGMEDKRFEVEQRARTAEAGKAEYDLDWARRTEPQKIEKLQLELGNLRRTGRLDEARAIEKEMQNKNFDAAWALTQREANARIAASGMHAQAAMLNAQKTPSATAAYDRMAGVIKRANPILPGETPEAYDKRLAELEYQASFTSKSTPQKDALAQIDRLLKLADSAPDDATGDLYRQQADTLMRSMPQDAGGVGGGTVAPPQNFATLGDAIAAKKTGKIHKGDIIIVNGRRAVVD